MTTTFTPNATGLMGKPVEFLIAKFFGALENWPFEKDGRNFTQSQIVATCQYISNTGDCLWHAQSVVQGTRCNCAPCRGEK